MGVDTDYPALDAGKIVDTKFPLAAQDGGGQI
jgi:hypothetical protein